MKYLLNLICIISLYIQTATSIDACGSTIRCTCSSDLTTVNCDSKDFTNLTTIDFPSTVRILSLINNKLKFDTIADRSKIEQLVNLKELNLNSNPLGTIPLLNASHIESLSLQDTSLISAKVPLTYANSVLQSLKISNNRIRSIDENDFLSLRNLHLKTLHIDNAYLTGVHQNAFIPLIDLQALSLKNNQLKSSNFLATLQSLSSIKLNGNQFTSIPQHLSTPGKIKNIFLTHNLISIIDETSPLQTWLKMNYTDIKIYLANNTFDCCQLSWFIRFLKTSSHFVGDANLLTCTKPSSYAEQFLIQLNPDDMNCSGIIPKKSWWIGGIVVAVLITILSSIFLVHFIVRRRQLRSGYTEIGGVNDPTPSVPSASELPFPPYGEENHDDDVTSVYSTAFSRITAETNTPSVSTNIGVSAKDDGYC